MVYIKDLNLITTHDHNHDIPDKTLDSIATYTISVFLDLYLAFQELNTGMVVMLEGQLL